MLASSVPNKNKNVITIPSLHYDDSIDAETAEKKPEVITFHNLTEGGVIFWRFKSLAFNSIFDKELNLQI